MQKSPLLHHKTIKKQRENVELTDKQIVASRKWLGYLDADELEVEKENYPKFQNTILRDILGFPEDSIGFEVDNVEFSYPAKGDKKLCIECKGTKTVDLYAPQGRDKKEHATPIKQTWAYMSEGRMPYGICTNYKDFVLITKDGYPKTHLFDFQSIKENPEEKLKEFIGIFSKERLIDEGGFEGVSIEDLHEESVKVEREFTTEFYKLFHQTRLMMIKAFQEKEGVTKDEAINYAQLYLNRLIFIFFAEDNKLLEKKLFMERVKKSLNSNLSEYSKSVSDQILELFKIMDGGSDKLGIVGFGGELFQERIPSKIHFLDYRDKKLFKDITQQVKVKITPDDETQNLIKIEKKLNPIIINLLMMDSFDFTTDLNVNILGRIFEQSISDLEELKEEKVSRRKKEGIFYTPEEITDYVCRNTIISYLSKSGANSVHELIREYIGNIEELEKKFREIKILDPACGSGAFLIKAVDTLLEIHREIQTVKEFEGKYSDNGQFQLTKWNEESEAKEIIEKSIYGVDVNRESVAVTKLALFLKIASRGKRLIELTKNIKVGNSLISDKSIDNAFDWESEFPEIFDEKGKRKENPGFDVVIGNPPYVRQEKIKPLKESLKKKYEIFVSTADLYTYFYEHGVNLLRDNGILGYISSNKFMRAKYGSQLRNFLKHKTSLKIIIDFGDTHLFDAITNTAIVIAKKGYEKNNKLLFSNDVKSEPTTSINQDELDESAWTLADENILNIKKKIEEIGTVLKEWDVKINRGLLTGFNEAFMINSETQIRFCKEDPKSTEIIKPIIRGRDIERYYYTPSDTWIINTHNGFTINSKKIPPINVKKDFPAIYKHLEEINKQTHGRLEKRQDKGKHWANLRNCAFIEDFKTDKIIWIELTSENRFAFSTKEEYILAGAFLMTGKSLKYLLAFLNSTICKFYFKLICNSSGMGTVQWKEFSMERIPIPKLDEEKQQPFIKLVDQILNITNEPEYQQNQNNQTLVKELEEKINSLFYKMYELTPETIEWIENA